MAYRVRTSGSSSYVVRTYACDSAGTASEHVFDVMLASGEYPKFCPQCGFAVDQRRKPRPSKVSIGGKPIVRTTDRMYRSIEESSAARAEALNNPALKITNMRDNLREGDVAAPAPQVSPQMNFYMNEASKAGIRYGWGSGAMGAPAFGSATPSPVPTNAISGPGHAALWAIQGEGGRQHQQTVAAAKAVGQVNKDEK